jgi:Xaa-Pro aminopeptidase
MSVKISKQEFAERIDRIRQSMHDEGIEVFMIFGDEYRRENLRYVSNFWPLFERGMLVIGQKAEPVMLVAPEGERYAREMSVWQDLRIIKEMEMAYVPDKIEYSTSLYSDLSDILTELNQGKEPKKIGVCGLDAMSSTTLESFKAAVPNAEFINSNDIIFKMRLIKSAGEIEVLKKVWEICDIGYKAVLDSDIVGLTEIQAAAIGEKAARDAGAESITFTIFASGERTNTVIGRPTEKIIEAGDMIMYALAVQYQGYIASDEWPFVAGGNPSPKQQQLIHDLIVAEDIGIKAITPGVKAGKVIKEIRDYFNERGLSENDLYPPIHGNGLAEAESPYPDENSTYAFEKGMGINFDVSLFGVEGVGSNRIEEGFIIGEEGLITLSPLISGLRELYLKKYRK